MYGFLYVREHPSYDYTCKVGITANIPERDGVYATGELHRGKFTSVFKIDLGSMGSCPVLKEREKDPRLKTIETTLKNTFPMFHVYYDGGTEFFDREVIVEIEPFLQSISLHYTRLSEEEIQLLTRCKRIKPVTSDSSTRDSSTRDSDTNVSEKETETNEKVPRPYQSEIIDLSLAHFQTNDKGILDLICGVGKTMTSLWITQGLQCNTFVVGVPNTLLLKQWAQVISELFGSIPCLTVSLSKSKQEISDFLVHHPTRCVVLTTYASAHKVEKVTKRLSFEFDMKINDEVHHLTSKNMEKDSDKKEYIRMLYIPSKKQLSLTATLKQLEGEGSISNTDVHHFGSIIETKCLLWAIQKNILCDYQIQTMIMKEEHQDGLFAHFQVTEENDKRLFLSAYAALKSIADGNSHHILMYSNSQEHSCQMNKYIRLLLLNKYFNIGGLYYSDYHSNMKKKSQDTILSRFDVAPFGIISCVYCLGEGWDFPKLDATVFAENMTSNIRIVQSALRANRKNSQEPAKIAKLILPMLNYDERDDTNPDFKKVREVVYQMGQEDASILQKIKAYHIDGKPHQRLYPHEKVVEFGEYDDEFTQRLRLKTIDRSVFGLTYAKAKTLVATKGLKSKQEYSVSSLQDIRLPLDPETTFHEQFTNWVDYLSIERNYYDLDTCKKKVAEYMRQYPEFKPLQFSVMMEKMKQLDVSFPPHDLWEDYYQEDINTIIVIPKKKKRIGCI
jgi:superfamily II DNA or RNA helicase